MQKLAYKMNINHFTHLCVSHNLYVQLWTPKAIGKVCAIVPNSWNLSGISDPCTIETCENMQLEEGQIIIIETPKQIITIPLTENDIQDLSSGEEFDWTFEDQHGKSVDVLLRPEIN